MCKVLGVKCKGVIFCSLLFNFYFLTFPCSLQAVMLGELKIAYVDVERVFEECAITQKMRENFKEKIAQTRVLIKEKEKKLAEMRQLPLIEELTPRTTFQYLLPSTTEQISLELTPSATVQEMRAGKPAPTRRGDLGRPISRQEEIEKLELEINRLKQESPPRIFQKEAVDTKKIMQILYEVIKEVAKEAGYAIVLDKKDVVFSSSSGMDITDKVIKRMEKKK